MEERYMVVRIFAIHISFGEPICVYDDVGGKYSLSSYEK